jgi:hypothetical protein
VLALGIAQEIGLVLVMGLMWEIWKSLRTCVDKPKPTSRISSPHTDTTNIIKTPISHPSRSENNDNQTPHKYNEEVSITNKIRN